MSEGTPRRRLKKAPVSAHVQLEETNDDRKLRAGETLEFNYGEELYAPVQYHSFRVGGHRLTLVAREGESVGDLAERGRCILDEVVEAEFPHRLELFRQRYGESKGRG